MTDEEKLVEEAKRDPRHVESEPKFVYFMQAKIGGPIKIGIAADPIKRKASVQTGYPYPLQITQVVAGWTYHELGLHEAFDSVRLSGEWFLPHPVLAEFANAVADDSLASIGVGDPREVFRPMPPPPVPLPPKWERRGTITFRPEPDELGWRATSAA